MLHKHAESTAPVVAIATRDLALQAMDVSGPNQQTPMINKVSTTYVLLATAIVAIQGQTAKREKCRAVIDLGSHLNLMSRRMADQLGLPTFSTSQGILGIGQTAQGSSSWARVLLSSLSSNFQKEIDVFILPQLIKNQPSESVDEGLSIPSTVVLADPILAVADFSISKPNRMEAKNYLKQSQAKTIFIQEKSGFDRKVILYSEAKRLRSGSGR